jgi:hypothetical protein
MAFLVFEIDNIIGSGRVLDDDGDGWSDFSLHKVSISEDLSLSTTGSGKRAILHVVCMYRVGIPCFRVLILRTGNGEGKQMDAEI